jgi:hypothetical protein
VLCRGTVFPGSLSDVLSEHPELAAAIFLESSERCAARLTSKVSSAGALTADKPDFSGDTNHGSDDDDDDFHDAEDDAPRSPAKDLTLVDCVEGLSSTMQKAVDNAGLLQVRVLLAVGLWSMDRKMILFFLPTRIETIVAPVPIYSCAVTVTVGWS